MSNLIPFHRHDGQGKGFMVKLMQHGKILPYISNILRSISLIIQTLYRNLNNSDKKQSEVCNLSRYVALAAPPYPLGFIHLGLNGWILDVERKAPKWGASFLPWYSCQVKFCEWVCGESLYEVKIASFVINIEFFSPFLHFWILPWWSDRYLDSFCAFEERLKLLWMFDSHPSHLARMNEILSYNTQERMWG